jgi:ABC-three component (ABC-3C) system Middle Component 6
MLLPDNIHPFNCIYFNGAIVLQVLQQKGNVELIELYQVVKTVHNMTFSVFILCLDWLYLINVATLKENKVKLCS